MTPSESLRDPLWSDRHRSGAASVAVMFLLGLLAGVVLLGAVRLAVMPEPEPAIHFHANWAVFVDGQRVDLTANRYMEDVGACSADPSQQRPEDRIHMHEGNEDVVHVHDSGTTWGHLMTNIGLAVGDDFVQLDQGTYADGDGRTLKFVVNGSQVRSIVNRPVRDLDRLLISFGPESAEEVIATQFPQVAENAAEFNESYDPASCSGHEVEETFGDRVRKAFWF